MGIGQGFTYTGMGGGSATSAKQPQINPALGSLKIP